MVQVVGHAVACVSLQLDDELHSDGVRGQAVEHSRFLVIPSQT